MSSFDIKFNVSSSLLETMWKTCADNAIGGLLKPWQMVRTAKAEANCLRILAKGERDAQLLLKGDISVSASFDTLGGNAPGAIQRIDPELDMSSLGSMVADNYVGEALRKDVNVTKALLHAAGELQKDSSPVPEKKVEADWIRRWRDIVGEVSSEDLQYLWGMLLAGEFKSPGKHSFRTLEIIRNLSTDDAELIAKLANLVTHDFVWCDNKLEQIERIGIDFDDVLYLEEIGILATVNPRELQKRWGNTEGADSFKTTIVGKKIALQVLHPDKDFVINISGLGLTRAGCQIIDLCNVQGDRDYMEELGLRLKEKGCSVWLCDVKEIGEEQVEILEKMEL